MSDGGGFDGGGDGPEGGSEGGPERGPEPVLYGIMVFFGTVISSYWGPT